MKKNMNDIIGRYITFCAIFGQDTVETVCREVGREQALLVIDMIAQAARDCSGCLAVGICDGEIKTVLITGNTADIEKFSVLYSEDDDMFVIPFVNFDTDDSFIDFDDEECEDLTDEEYLSVLRDEVEEIVMWWAKVITIANRVIA